MATKHLCPTHELELPDDRELEYFARNAPFPPAADDIGDLYEDTQKVVHFLGALAEARSRAVFQAMAADKEDEEWVMWLAWLAEKLTEEAACRLRRVEQAGRLWEEWVPELEKAEKRGK
jgi:hypothetical protein